MLLADIEGLREQQRELAAVVKSDAGAYARSVSDQSPEQFAGDVRTASADLVRTYGPVAGEASALFYETQRPARTGRIEVAEPSIDGRLMAALSWAVVPMFRPDEFPDPLSSVVERVGAVTAREVQHVGRETMLLTAAADSSRVEVSRYARAGACGFCAYMTTVDAFAYADTEWHANCSCVTVPRWADNPLPSVEHLDQYAEASNWARNELSRRQRELATEHGLSSRDLLRSFPDVAINTRNLSRLVREHLGLAH